MRQMVGQIIKMRGALWVNAFLYYFSRLWMVGRLVPPTATRATVQKKRFPLRRWPSGRSSTCAANRFICLLSAFAGHSAGRQPPAVCRAGILSVPVHAVFPQLYPRRFWRQPYFQCNAGKGRISQISARRCPKLYSGFSCAAVCAVFLLLSSLPSAGCMAFRRAAVAGRGRLGSAGGFPHDERSLPSVCVRPHGTCACPQHRVRLARHRRGAGGGIRAAAAGP